MPQELPAESTLKNRRRRKPIFLDEPIQWHLRTTKHDRCPWCGLSCLMQRGSRQRYCTNCEGAYKLDYTPQEWFDAKINNQPLDAAVWEEPYPFEVNEADCYDLKEAQLRSERGRAMVYMQRVSDASKLRVYWHRQGHLPEHFDGIRACEGASQMHQLLRDLREVKIWTPDASLNEMEVLARAYGTDDDMFSVATTFGS